MTRKRKWLLIGAAVVLVGIGLGAYFLFNRSGTDHITLSQLKAQGESLNGQLLRVAGKVDPTSINWDARARVLRFALTDNSGNRLNVVYRGVPPDGFQPGVALAVEGVYQAGSEFEAFNFPTRSLCNVCH